MILDVFFVWGKFDSLFKAVLCHFQKPLLHINHTQIVLSLHMVRIKLKDPKIYIEKFNYEISI